MNCPKIRAGIWAAEERGGPAVPVPEEPAGREEKSYTVFPGINLVYENIHGSRRRAAPCPPSGLYEIRHCLRGRLESSLGEQFYYLGPGDLSIGRPREGRDGDCFPLGYYQGIRVEMDVDKTPRCLSCFLEDVDVEPRRMTRRLCGDDRVFVARSMAAVEHIFSELYSVREEFRKAYMKVKVLELMLFLSRLDADSDELEQRSCSGSQRRLAWELSRYLAENLDRNFTTQELAEQFAVSAAQLRLSIKSVYGSPLHAYIRRQKMESAAHMLRESSLSITDIAGRHGYDNASKFSSAFRELMGCTPREYRSHGVEEDIFPFARTF